MLSFKLHFSTLQIMVMVLAKGRRRRQNKKEFMKMGGGREGAHKGKKKTN